MVIPAPKVCVDQERLWRTSALSTQIAEVGLRRTRSGSMFDDDRLRNKCDPFKAPECDFGTRGSPDFEPRMLWPSSLLNIANSPPLWLFRLFRHSVAALQPSVP